ncbi:tetratricopeptide repeat protein [Larkinella rosea]|uniref:Tetratricopeptide repeat-containing protein n=1 Tax=Larkinella rosea TaxID=2025312 RepID=A0A3P1C073_9BACT|nr:tetratricopeptide repeat protein [Larkinella rosea]RRB06453.1 tetratricopeptide repeat-containing protein [Larkinella rosea]
MTYLILSVLLWLYDNRSFDKISHDNIARIEGLRAYQSGNYKRAAEQYVALVNSALFVEPSARLNLAHSYFQLRQYAQAQKHYRLVARVNQPDLAATAEVQLGVISVIQGDSSSALAFFRKAMNTVPALEPAQFNYELIKKTYSGKPLPNSSQRPKPKPQQRTEEMEVAMETGQDSGTEVEQGDNKDELLRRLRSLNLSEEQALSILNAMQDNEVQYIHQRKQTTGSKNRQQFNTY